MSGTSLQHKIKSSIHYRLCPYTRHSRTERHVFTPGGLPYCPYGLILPQGETIIRQKSAEGIVAGGNEPHSVGRSHPDEGPNGARTEWYG